MVDTTKNTKVDVGLAAAKLKPVAEKLNQYLADLQVAYTKLHNYHWNVEGDSFFTLHAQLEEMYTAVNAEIDEVAERILKIGYRPVARLVDYVELSHIEETQTQGYNGQEIAATLAGDYKHLCEELRELVSVAETAGDEGTADDAVGTLKEKEKLVWMLTAYKK